MILEHVMGRSILRDILVPAHYVADEWVRYEWTIVFLFSDKSIQLSVDQSIISFSSVSTEMSSWVIHDEFKSLPVRWKTTLTSRFGELISAVEYFDTNTKGVVLLDANSLELPLVAFELQGEFGTIKISLDYDKLELLSRRDLGNYLEAEYRDGLYAEQVNFN